MVDAQVLVHWEVRRVGDCTEKVIVPSHLPPSLRTLTTSSLVVYDTNLKVVFR